MITVKDLEQHRQRWADIDQYTEKIRLCKQRLLRYETSAGFQNSQDPILRQNYNDTKEEMYNIILKINETIRKLTEMDAKIEELLNLIPKQKVRQALRHYYLLSADDIDDVAATLDISRRTAYRLLAEGVQMIEAVQK